MLQNHPFNDQAGSGKLLNLCHVKTPEVPVSYLKWLSVAGIAGVRYSWSLSGMFV